MMALLRLREVQLALILALLVGVVGARAPVFLSPKSVDSLFSAPRILNAPTGWWFSCLTKTSAPSNSFRVG